MRASLGSFIPGGSRAFVLLAVLPLTVAAAAAAPLEINGSTTVGPVVEDAARILRAERGLEIRVDTLGGSSGGIAALGDGRVDVGMSSRPLAAGDSEKFPGVDFRPTAIGVDGVALVVSADVWKSGLTSLSRDQMRAIYERRVTNWRDLGGPERRIAFFNKEPGRGTWEVFARWLYGSADEAPLVSFPEVGSNEEAFQKVGSTRGAITQLSAAWADGERVFALAIEDEKGQAIAADDAAIRDGRYPMGRTLFVITDGEPAGKAALLIDLLLSARGQKLLSRHGYLPLAAAAPEPASP